jgi:hypothetical protein
MKQKIKFLKPDLFNYGDSWEDYYLELKSVKKGDVFYECERYGENYELIALEDARKVRGGWACWVQTHDKGKFELFVSSNTTYCGPNFFKAPQHLTQLETGEYVYVVK